MHSETPRWFWAIAALWLICAVAGLSVLWRYDTTPGESANAPRFWPNASRLARAADGPTLVMLAHPQCSCTSASIDELGEVLARADRAPKVYVVFLRPLSVSTTWSYTGLWEKATRLPGAMVVRDDDGVEARAFAASTSGQTVLYDARGALTFSGGITAARAHRGDNAGRQSLVALLNGAPSDRGATSVFGCPLFSFAG